tara:strand:- start:9308 stop:10123 length:816 start_codon:yes stop_codon:yes gene_type:complete
MIQPEQALIELNIPDPTTLERAIVVESIKYAYGAIKQYLHYDPVLRSHTQYYRNQHLRNDSLSYWWNSSATDAFMEFSAVNRSDELQLQHLPLRNAGTESAQDPVVYVDALGRNGTVAGSFTDLLVEGTDYWGDYDVEDDNGAKVANDGILRGYRWNTEPGGIKIIYWAGYSPAELYGHANVLDATPIMSAMLIETVRRFKQAVLMSGKKSATGFSLGMITQERLGDYSYSIGATSAGSLVDRNFGNRNSITQESANLLESFVNHGWSMHS